MSDTNENSILKIGEIFEYKIENEGEVDKNTAFFMKVGLFYYLIDIDSDSGEYAHYELVSGMNFKDRKREGKDPFSYQDVMAYLKARKIKATGRMVVPIEIIKQQKEEFPSTYLNIGTFYKT